MIQPVSLGWHFKRADAIASYTIFAPTGRYTNGASNNTGLGMWGQELAFGTTVYLNEKREYHAATIASFDFQSKKEDSVLIRGKNRVFALGPDATLAIARHNTVYGFARVCYQWETYARTTTQGGAWNISVTFLLKPIKVPTP